MHKPVRSLVAVVALLAATSVGAQTDASSPSSNAQPNAGSAAATEQAEPSPPSDPPNPNDGLAESAAEGSHRPAFLVRLRMLEAGTVPGPLMGVLDFQNVKDEALTVKSVSITPYGRLGGLYTLTKVAGEFPIRSKSWSNPLPVQIPGPTTWLTPYQMATAKTGPAEFLIAIDYFENGKTDTVSENTVATAVVGTSPLYIFVGGVVGAFLLVTFIWASKVVDCAKRGTWPAVAARARPLTLKWAVMAVAYTLNGLIVAIILWVLATGLTTFQLPIAFQLRDFSGGLLAGLFSGMLAKSISEKLSLT